MGYKVIISLSITFKMCCGCLKNNLIDDPQHKFWLKK